MTERDKPEKLPGFPAWRVGMLPFAEERNPEKRQI